MRRDHRQFRNKAQRSVVATWVVFTLSIAAAALVALYLRHPSG
jgi:hypothetical protein